MADNIRIYLDVPYAEKDQAKALGARWDPARKQWWIDSQRVSPADFSRWTPDPAPTSISTTGPTVKVRLLGLAQPCWRCKSPTTALVGLLPTASSNVNNMLACKNDRVLRLAAAALPEAARRAAQVGVLKSRFSRTENRSYTSNGCFHCDALIGNFFLYSNELRSTIKRHGLAGLTTITNGDLPYQEIRPFLNRSNTWAGVVLTDVPYAYLLDESLDNGTAGGSWDFDLSSWRATKS